MAGLEQIEIHSKSYLIRWIESAGGHTISWSLQPHKKSISFGIFKHPGTNSNSSSNTSLTPRLPQAGLTMVPVNDEPPNSNSSTGRSRSRGQSLSSYANPPPSTTTTKQEPFTSVTEKLQSLGMKSVSWHGKCEADEVSAGRYDVPETEGGMYGMVFDNTHSKQLSKTVTFVVITFPTGMPPKSGNQARFRSPMIRQGSTTTVSNGGVNGKPSPSLEPVATTDTEPFPTDLYHSASTSAQLEQPKGTKIIEVDNAAGEPTFYTGQLAKKRRKRNQGWAKRFFSLDFTSSTLSYYKNRNSSALRGAIPLSLAAIAADARSHQISIDSGAEIWLLRAANHQEFERWRDALEKASVGKQEFGTEFSTETTRPAPEALWSAEEERDWGRAETLVGKVAGITDSVRRLAKDTDPKYAPTGLGLVGNTNWSGSPSPTLEPETAVEYFSPSRSPDRSSSKFWTRKSSTGGQSPSGMFRRSVSAQKLATASLAIPTPNHAISISKQRPSSSSSHVVHPHQHHTEDVHERCMAVLRDLDAVVFEFSSLIAESRRRRQPPRPQLVSRKSIETTHSQEFFDADDGAGTGTLNPRSQILRIRGDSELDESNQPRVEESTEAVENYNDNDNDDSDSESDLDEAFEESFASMSRPGHSVLFPARPKSLTPLPNLPRVTRRSTIPPSVGQPPSLIAFLRKNVGKDLSTISMPVTANEPLSLLQRQAEQMEYSHLLDQAVSASADTGERLLYVTAFALSPLSNSRLKERASRKPFNPMLGETFELLSPATETSSAFRFVSEKISHRPVRVACQAEADKWTFTHAPSPSQKFWGKSAEITTSGKCRVVLRHSSSSGGGSSNGAQTATNGSTQASAQQSTYSWTPATAFLRNIIAGEKYIEPVSSITIYEESSGRKAVATFKAGGMFSGRSEDVSVVAYDPSGSPLPIGLVGKWTSSLSLASSSHPTASESERQIWKVNDLPTAAGKRYGFTAFACGLNEITSLELLPGESSEGTTVIPPTDSRLRPDQRAYENGDVDTAEKLKAQLEEAQRRRRKEMEMKGEVWESRWFEVVGSDGAGGGGGGGEGGEEVWALKTGDDDYWSVRSAVAGFKHGKWDGVRSVFEVE